MESKLLELKARVKSIDAIRKKLLDLKAIYVGTFRQVDTYFSSPKGRLKLRKVDDQENAKLIYYCREDITGPKLSEIVIIDIQDPESFKALFKKLLGKRVRVDKERVIYTYEGTQVHLDTVKNLGTFIEFERRISNVNKDRRVLEKLMKRLKIEQKDLIQGSYSDLLS